jgi:hypothetical protein
MISNSFMDGSGAVMESEIVNDFVSVCASVVVADQDLVPDTVVVADQTPMEPVPERVAVILVEVVWAIVIVTLWV